MFITGSISTGLTFVKGRPSTAIADRRNRALGGIEIVSFAVIVWLNSHQPTNKHNILYWPTSNAPSTGDEHAKRRRDIVGIVNLICANNLADISFNNS